MFLPYRTIGYVVDHNPPMLQRLGNTNFLYTTIGRSWQIYNLTNLRLKNTSPEKDGQIAAMAGLNNKIMATAIGRQIVFWRRTQEIFRVTPPEGTRLVKLLAIGDILISLSHDGHLYTWDCSDIAVELAKQETAEAISNAEVIKVKGTSKDASLYGHTALTLEFSTHLYLPPPPSDHNDEDMVVKNVVSQKKEVLSTVSEADAPPIITSWCHPNTYKNKILVGWSNGVLELWNIKTGKKLLRFESIAKHDMEQFHKNNNNNNNNNNKNALNTQDMVNMFRTKGINCIENAPALDVVAIGRANGDIILLNVKADKIIHTYRQTDGAVTALTFRSDDTHQHLLTGSSSGGVTLWDLKNKEAIWSKGGVHGNGVTACFFLHREPILITTGRDNAIIQWHFEGNQMTMLRTKQGHYRPPNDIKWYSFNEIITGSNGDGSLRYWSPTRDRAAQMLSWSAIPTNAHRTYRGERYGFLTNQQRVIRGIDLTPITHPHIPNCATLNSADTDKVTLWSIENHRAEKLIGSASSAATTLCYSYCGQYLYVGYRAGDIHKYNIESQALRAVLTPDKVLSTSHGDAAIVKATMTKSKKQRIESKAIQSGALLDKSSSHGTHPHQHGIAGLYCAVGNDHVVSIGRDGVIYTWDTKEDAMIKKLSLPKAGANVVYTHYSAEQSLLGVITSENDLFLIDTERLVVIRQWLNTTAEGYSTQRGRLNQLLLHPHLGLMFVSDSLGGIKTYDLATGVAIDYTLFSKPILAFDICDPSRDVRSAGDMLVTTHVGCIGVYIWIINPNRYINSSLLASTSNIMNAQKNNNNTALITSKVDLSQGNVDKYIDQDTLDEEKRKFEERQEQLVKKFCTENEHIDLENDNLFWSDEKKNNKKKNDMNDNDNNDDDEEEDDDDENENENTEDEELDMKYNTSKNLNKYEKKIYHKLCETGHFTTVNVLRNVSMFDQFITKPNIQLNGKDLIDMTKEATNLGLVNKKITTTNNDNNNNGLITNNTVTKQKQNDVEEDAKEKKKLQNILIIQKILFKQLQNEMNQKLTMLSGVSASRWKLLTQQQAIAQRNEQIKQQQLKATEDVPFFLNIQTGQTKTASKTIYHVDPLMNIQQQQHAILGKKNVEFNLYGSGDQGNGDNTLNEFIINISTTQDILDYINPSRTRGSLTMRAGGGDDDDDDDEYDDVLISVNDKKRLAQNAALKQKQGEEDKLTPKQKKALEKEKLLKLKAEAKLKNEKTFDVCALLRFIYQHQLPQTPPQHFIDQYLAEHPEQQYNDDITETIVQHYHTFIKNLKTATLKINHAADRRALAQITTHFLTTPPSLLSLQISVMETEYELFALLHVFYLLTASAHNSRHASGGMIDAVNALLKHALDQHKILISQSPLCRTMAALLAMALKKQWSGLESLFQSNLAVINHLLGAHQGF